MFRFFHRTTISWLSSNRRKSIGTQVVTGATLGLLGVVYYSRQHRIYADSNSGGSEFPDKPARPDDDSTRYLIYRDRLSAQTRYSPTPPNRDRISEQAVNFSWERANGILRVDYLSIPNYNPPWDALATCCVTLEKGPNLTLLSILNGINGPETKSYLVYRLLSNVLKDVINLISECDPFHRDAERTEIGTMSFTPEQLSKATDRTIKETFLDLDRELTDTARNLLMSSRSKAAAVRPLGVALSGSSVLLSFFDDDSRTLKVALTGNSRAVLGRVAEKKNGLRVYEAHALTIEQDTSNPAELERLRHLHPAEEIGSFNAYAVTRAFGLAIDKWSHEIQERLHMDHLGDFPRVSTPPFVTAEPEVTTIEVKPGDFLVMASNGLWNSLTNEEVVGLVGMWLDEEMYFTPETPALTPVAEIIQPENLPVLLGTNNTILYNRWRTPKEFVCIDNNAAGHLVRNALGGADRDLTTALLDMEPPRSWYYRYDMNVAVIFFDR